MQSLRKFSALLIFFIGVFLLSSCTAVHVVEGETVKVERFFGMPIVQVVAGESSMAAVRLKGVGLMMSDSNVLLGYADEFSVKKDLTQDNCSMIVLIESNADAVSLLREINANREIYSNVCAININAEKGTTND